MTAITDQTNQQYPGFEVDTLARYLLPVSLFYLALPALIFFIGWLNPTFAALFVLLTAIPLVYHLLYLNSGTGPAPTSSQPVLGPRHLAIITIVALLIVGISGIGGYGHQDSDWRKHNAILKDLIERPWPLVYEIDGVSLPMVYYIAYYLPAAVVGKWLGAAWTNHILLLWSWVGLILSLLWFIILIRHRPYLSLLLFVIFSGLDALGMGVHHFVLGPMSKWDHFEWWAENWQYSANLTLLLFVPHQALCGWILTGLLFYTMLQDRGKETGLFYLSLTPLWSPLITFGLFPYVLADFWLSSDSILGRFKRYLSLPNLCGLAILGVYALFYSSKFYEIAIPLHESVYGFIFNVPETENATGLLILGLLICFLLLEFGLYAFLIVPGQIKPKQQVILITTLVFLVVLPLFKYGRNNDLVMRASIPALFIFAVFLAQTLITQTGLRRGLLLTLIFIGTITPLVEVSRHLQKAIREEGFFPIPDLTTVPDLFIIQKDQYQGESFLVQYLGSAESPFFKLMAKNTACQLPPAVELQVVEPEPFFYHLSDRFTLLCVDKHLIEGHLLVNLLLQTKPPLDKVETHDTIYVHLLNEQGERVAGSDILLYKNYEEKSISIHDLMLPSDLPAGTYHLAVGTYYFDKDILVNVGSVNLKTRVVVN